MQRRRSSPSTWNVRLTIGGRAFQDPRMTRMTRDGWGLEKRPFSSCYANARLTNMANSEQGKVKIGNESSESENWSYESTVSAGSYLVTCQLSMFVSGEIWSLRTANNSRCMQMRRQTKQAVVATLTQRQRPHARPFSLALL